MTSSERYLLVLNQHSDIVHVYLCSISLLNGNIQIIYIAFDERVKRVCAEDSLNYESLKFFDCQAAPRKYKYFSVEY